MRKLLIFIILAIVVGCKNKRKRPEPNFFRNLYTGEIISQKDLDSYIKKINFTKG